MKAAFLMLGLAILSDGCNNAGSDGDDTPVDTSYILGSAASQMADTSIKDLRSLKLQLDARLSFIEDTARLVAGEGNVKGETVKLIDQIALLFDPSNHPCELPAKVKKKLAKLKDNGDLWAPKYVVDYVKTLPDSVIYVPRQSISNLLHWISVRKNGASAPVSLLITGAPTYNDLAVEQFILRNYSNFFYSLDCSGYLNAAIEASGAVPGGDIKGAAKSALDNQTSMFLGGGVIISPLAAAYYGDKVVMDTATRIKVLSAILKAIPQPADNDVIDMDLSYDAVWASSSGASSFNGKADISGGGSAGIGVASISASSSGGGAISRKSAFSSFKTYFTGAGPLQHPEPLTVAKIKAAITSLQQQPSNP